MKDRQPAMGIPRIVLLVVALLLPTLSLLPLGTLWLWEHGYIVYWAIGTCVAVTRRLLPAEAADRAAAGRTAAGAGETHEPGDPQLDPAPDRGVGRRDALGGHRAG